MSISHLWACSQRFLLGVFERRQNRHCQPAGMLLRLAADGHEEVEIMGPPGVRELVESFRSIFSWQHPRALVTAFSRNTSLFYRYLAHRLNAPILSYIIHVGPLLCI